MPTFTITIGGQLDTAGRATDEPPLATQTAITTTTEQWDEITHGHSEVSAQ